MRLTDIFVLLVVRHKVMTMTEFYEADAFDIDLITSHLDQAERDAAERMRMTVWAALAPNSKKKLSPDDILKFSWEKATSEPAKPTTKEDFDKAFGKYIKQ